MELSFYSLLSWEDACLDQRTAHGKSSLAGVPLHPRFQNKIFSPCI